MNKAFVLERLARRGLTQTDLAKIMDVNKAQITRLLNGQRELKAREVVPLAHVLQTTPTNILNNLGELA